MCDDCKPGDGPVFPGDSRILVLDDPEWLTEALSNDEMIIKKST